MPTVIPPPPQYTHYSGPVIEYRLPLDEVRRYCQEMGNGVADACAALATLGDGSKTCVIVLPLDGFDSVARYREHELGHCAGWGKDHPPD